MRRRLSRGALLTISLAFLIYPVQGAPADPSEHPVLQRFFADDAPELTEYRALRRMKARSEKLKATAWMDVWTEADASGFRYSIASEGGSAYIRSRVFEDALETEQRLWTSGESSRGAITPENYLFQDRGEEPSGLTWIGVKPRRKDVLLVDGSIYLQPEDGDLVRIQGLLSKTPSFWTRRVEIDRRYQRIAGVRLPVSLDSVANVLLAGRSTMTIAYEYESVNGQRVGSPAVSPRVATPAEER
jgi:hypothetical protein